MANPSQLRGQAGATHLRFGDVIVALVLLGLLLYAAWKQFPVYNLSGGAHNTASQSSHQP
jgi:hypothetical protein